MTLPGPVAGQTPSLSVVEAGGTIVGDVVCRRCAYNLRGLPVEGRCPECGTPAGLSTWGDLLRFSDPLWLSGLRRGTALVLWDVLVTILVAIAGVLLAEFSGPGTLEWIMLFGGLLGVGGAWLLTEPDPSGLGERQYAKARKITRVALFVGVAASLTEALLATFGAPEMLAGTIGGAIVAAQLFGLVGEFAMFYYLEKLALRVPDEKLAQRARFLRWAFTIALGLSTIAGLIIGIAPGGAAGSWAVLGCFTAVVGLCVIVFAVMTVFMYFRFHRVFRAQEALSRQLWTHYTPKG